MKSEDKPQGERVRDEQTIAMLKELSGKLFSEDINKARLAAHKLAWLQEDGFAILKLALFGDFSRTTKKAAAYGLRSTKGRMRKLAIELLQDGLNHRDKTTSAASKKALQLMKILPPEPEKPKQQRPKRPQRPHAPSGNRRVQDVPPGQQQARPGQRPGQQPRPGYPPQERRPYRPRGGNY